MPAAATKPDVLDGGAVVLKYLQILFYLLIRLPFFLPMPAPESASERTLSRTTARQHRVLSV
jgi:hypothetical protein